MPHASQTRPGPAEAGPVLRTGSASLDEECGTLSLYVVGGQQRSLRPLRAGKQSWYRYRKGVVLQVRPTTGAASRVFDYVSPPEVVAKEDPAVLFKSGTLVGDSLYLCTQTEVLTYRLPDFEPLHYLSLPQFNDLHHVRPTETGTLLVANTGLDMVMEVTPRGAVLNEWNVLGADPWERFSRSVDYRTVSTKPHRSHPNQVFCLGSDVWATRFEQRDAVCLTTPGKRIDIGRERVHDGVVHDRHIYFTTVQGELIVVDQATLRVDQVWELTRADPKGDIAGWCRGLLIEAGRIWIGFSRLRPTRFRENLSWVKSGFRRVLPTHIRCYDLSTGDCVDRIDLESHGLNAVFSLHAFPSTEPGPVP